MSGGASLNPFTTQISSVELASDLGAAKSPDALTTGLQAPRHLANENKYSSDNNLSGRGPGKYPQFTRSRKFTIVSILSLCTFLAPISCTAILAAVPELARDYQTTGSIINASNALYLVFMGISAPFWGALSQVWGRRPVFIASSGLFLIFSMATALSPNLPVYFMFRALTAFQGTSAFVVGNSVIGDIYEPQTRASALGWLLSAGMVGPAIGPFLGGIIVTYQSWRMIFWLISAMSGVAALLLVLFLPETIATQTCIELEGKTFPQKTKILFHHISPLRVITLLSYPNLFITGLSTGALVWNQYALLTPIRYVLNPRFQLSTPIQAGLFYLAPAAGYLVGTFLGGYWADYSFRKYIKRRNGICVPEDRLRTSLPWICLVTPACILIYGWSLDRAIGGISLPVIAMFFQGVAQLFCLPSLNTYCLDVMEPSGRSAEAVAGNYVFRYFLAALGTGVVLPAIESLGVGWFNTISALFLVLTGILVWLTGIYGQGWRQAGDRRYLQNLTREKSVCCDV